MTLQLQHILAIASVVVLLTWSAPATAGVQTNKNTANHSEKGLSIDFWLEPEHKSERPMMAGDFAEVRFRVTDAVTGKPVSPLQPGVWVDRINNSGDQLACQDRIKRYLQGGIAFQADIDLNKYFILVMNNDHTVSVIDPILGMKGYTQLYAMIRMDGRGEDWVHESDGRHLWVSLPEAGKLALIDLEEFETVRHIGTESRPFRVRMQPDGHYLWVGHDNTAEDFSGVSIIDVARQETVTTIATGPGHHEIAFSSDSRYAYVTNSRAATLSIIDTQTLELKQNLVVGTNPVSIAYDHVGDQVVVATEKKGELIFISADEHQVEQRLTTEPGLLGIYFDPDHRWGFALNPAANRVDIYDPRKGEVIHTLSLGSTPHHVSFTDNYAYIRSLGAPEVGLINLTQITREAPPHVQMIPFGSIAPGARTTSAGSVGSKPALAPSVSPTGEWGAVIAANQAETTIYYYMEGMVAPMGTFPTYGRIPRAVSIIDRSIKEYEKGVYGARIRIPESGDYNVAFVLDTPWIDHCFDFSAVPNPLDKTGNQVKRVKIKTLDQGRSLAVGKETFIDFQVTEPALNAIKEQQRIIVQLSKVPGKKQVRQEAEWLGDGRYRVRLTAKDQGFYYLFFAIPSLGLDATEVPYLVFRARPATEPPPESGT